MAMFRASSLEVRASSNVVVATRRRRASLSVAVVSARRRDGPTRLGHVECPRRNTHFAL